MRKITLIVMVVTLMLLSGCTRKISDYKNVVWKSDEGLLVINISGDSIYSGYGTLKVDNEEINIVAKFEWSQSKLEIYDENMIVQTSIDDIIDTSLITFKISAIHKWLFIYSDSEMHLQTYQNNSGINSLDDLELHMEMKN